MQMHARQDSNPFPPCQRVGKCARESTAGGILFGDKAAAAGSRCRMALAVPHRAQEKLAYQRGHRWPYRENVCNQNHKTVEVVPFYLCFFLLPAALNTCSHPALEGCDSKARLTSGAEEKGHYHGVVQQHALAGTVAGAPRMHGWINNKS